MKAQQLSLGVVRRAHLVSPPSVIVKPDPMSDELTREAHSSTVMQMLLNLIRVVDRFSHLSLPGKMFVEMDMQKI